MKCFFLAACLLLSRVVSMGQPGVAQARTIRPHIFGNDSVQLFYTGRYQLIEDSCATIVRYAHYDRINRTFYGPFRDVTADSPAVVVTEGAYNRAGGKEGDFVTRYLNGRLQSKAGFKNNKLAGPGELYYPDGKPKLVFMAGDKGLNILEAWTAEGKKTVEGGNGKYTVTLGAVSWTGKIANGRPDGEWVASTAVRLPNAGKVSEKFKDNKFVSGTNFAGTYTDSSQLLLIDERDFPFITAEKMQMSAYGCSAADIAARPKQIAYAHYRDGDNAFAQRIADAVNPFMKTVDLGPFDTELTIEAVVYKNGVLGGWQCNDAFDQKIVKGIINSLLGLPNFTPASVDGVPVDQKINILFRISKGMYSVRYRPLPLKAD